jgi:hypothetical protein
MALRLPPMGLRKAKALSRHGDAGSVQKTQRIKQRFKKANFAMFP